MNSIRSYLPVLQSILAFLLLTNLSLCDQKQNDDGIRYVNAIHGLYFRESPSLGSRALGLIPYGSRIRILEQLPEEKFLAGRHGKWSRIQWEEKEGWAFSGFLQRDELSGIHDHSLDGMAFRQGFVEASGRCVVTGPGGLSFEDGNVSLPLVSSGDLCKNESLHGTYSKDGSMLRITWRYTDISETCKNETYQATDWAKSNWSISDCQDGRLYLHVSSGSGQREAFIESR